MVWWKRGFLVVLLLLVGLIGYRMGRAVPPRPTLPTISQSAADPTEPRVDGQSAAPGELAGAPTSAPAKTPLIGALKSLVESSPVYDEADATGSLVDSLATADDLLSQAKQQNREALARLKRRPPVPGARSIVLINVRGLRLSDLAGENATADLAAMCAAGIEFTNCHTASPDPELAWRGLMQGLGGARPSEGNRATSLAEVLWRATYATAFCGIWREPDRLPIDSGYEHWFGVRGDNQAAVPQTLQFHSDQAAVKVDAKSAADVINATFADAQQWLKTAGRPPMLLHLSWGLPEEAAERTPAIAAISQALRTLLDEAASGRRFTIVLTSDLVETEDERPLSEKALQVPLVVWSGSPASRIHEPVWTCDVLPTLAEWGRAPIATSHDGRSLGPLLAGKDLPERLLYWKTTSKEPWQAALLGDWKGIVAPGSAIRLYDLSADPGEEVDVAQQHPKIVRQLVKDRPAAVEEAASEL